MVQRAAPWRLDPAWRLAGEGRWDESSLAEAVATKGVPTDPDRNTGAIRPPKAR